MVNTCSKRRRQDVCSCFGCASTCMQLQKHHAVVEQTGLQQQKLLLCHQVPREKTGQRCESGQKNEILRETAGDAGDPGAAANVERRGAGRGAVRLGARPRRRGRVGRRPSAHPPSWWGAGLGRFEKRLNLGFVIWGLAFNAKRHPFCTAKCCWHTVFSPTTSHKTLPSLTLTRQL